MNKSQLLYNAIVTPDGTTLVSRHVHDFVVHKDTKIGQMYGTDGGLDYQKLTGDVLKDCKNLAQYDDGGHSKRRVFLEWGVNTDKEGNKLPATRWTPIMELDTDHIQAIIKGRHTGNPLYLETFKDELELRGVKPAKPKKIMDKSVVKIDSLYSKNSETTHVDTKEGSVTVKLPDLKSREKHNYVVIFTICSCVMVASTLMASIYYFTKSHLNILGYPVIYAGIHWAIKKFIK